MSYILNYGFREYASLVLDCIPVVGNVKAVIEVSTGYDYIAGRKLETWEKWVTGLGIAGGTAVGVAKGLGKTGIKTLGKTYGDEILEGISNAYNSFKSGLNNIPNPFSSGQRLVPAGNGLVDDSINFTKQNQGNNIFESMKEKIQSLISKEGSSGSSSANSATRVRVNILEEEHRKN